MQTESRRRSGERAVTVTSTPKADAAQHVLAGSAGTSGSDDCRVCPLRARCISYGWMSPGGIWFENAVVLRPTPGCRGYEGRGADILRRFGSRDDDDLDEALDD